MRRIISCTIAILSLSAGIALSQTDKPAGRFNPRETKNISPIVEPSQESVPSKSPAKSSELSKERPLSQIAPSVIPEPVPVIPTKEGENGHTRVVCRLGNIPANDVAATLQKLFKTEGAAISESPKNQVVIVPDNMSNCVLVSGQPAAVEEVRRLIIELDRPTAIVRLEVRLTELPGDKKEITADSNSAEIKNTGNDSTQKNAKTSEKEILLVNAEITTVDGQSATSTLTAQEPHITGVAFFSSGRNNSSPIGRNNSVQYINVGTMFKMTPRIKSDGTIALEVDISDSRTGPIEEGALIGTLEKGEQVRSPAIDTFQTKTTLNLLDGKTTTISGMSRNGKARQLDITAHIIRPTLAKQSE